MYDFDLALLGLCRVLCGCLSSQVFYLLRGEETREILGGQSYTEHQNINWSEVGTVTQHQSF